MIRYNKEKPLRVFEAFGGYGSQSLALKRLKRDIPTFDYTVVGYSDIEPAAISAYMALHEGEGVINYGDVSKIDWSQVPDFDLFTYSYPCFIAGTLVLTQEGYKQIEDITDSDCVITHTNQYRRVIKPMRRDYKGNVVKVRAMCLDEIVCTEYHPFYVRRMFRKGHDAIRSFHEPEWIKAKNLDTNCYLGYAINQESKLPEWKGVTATRWKNNVNRLSGMLDKSCFWYIMGRYVGDGWKRESNTGNGIVICCSERNRSELERNLTSCGLHYTVNEERTVTKMIVSSNELFSFVDRYGKYAYGKCIDADTINLPSSLLVEFLRGYVESDGCVVNGYYKTSSVSRDLCYGIGQCVAKVFKRPFAIYHTKRKPQTVIEGRIVNQRDSYAVVWKQEQGEQDKAFYEDGYIWFPLTSLPVMEYAEVPVYNMSVEEDESYTANGAIVHNCTDISNAGLQKGFSKGSGTRSSLLWECERAIEAKRPRYLLMENVKALVQKKFLPEFGKWLSLLEGYGYKTWWQVMNAKNYGVPQNRERVFAISIFVDHDNQSFRFPEPFPLELCLADVLEEQVDEKYFLRDEMLVRFCKKSMDEAAAKQQQTEQDDFENFVVKG